MEQIIPQKWGDRGTNRNILWGIRGVDFACLKDGQWRL